MSSHGIPRASAAQPATDQDRKKEIAKIEEYKELVESVNTRTQLHQYTTATLELTSKLLKWNPEYYTIWNHRRFIRRHQFDKAAKSSSLSPDSDSHQDDQAIVNLVSEDLSFLIPLLRKFPKCYWVWSYRLWLLDESTRLLPANAAREIWQHELSLAGKMLNLDSRNFHGWGYRRTVVSALESSALQTGDAITSMTEQEFEYTTKMINSNLSNFSAWHNRSKLIPRLLGERNADHKSRRKFLDEELELIQRALWAASEDQSLWFYHQYLMSTFDPRYAADSIAPELSTEERSRYVAEELEKIQEMLEGAEDCKWLYQSLIQLSLLYRQITQQWPLELRQVEEWVHELVKLDGLRTTRWGDLWDSFKTS